MLELSALVKSVPFKLTESDDTVVELKATEYTVGDTLEMSKVLQTFGELDPEDPDITIKLTQVGFVRVMFSVKTTDGKYYWNDIDDWKRYPDGLIRQIVGVVNTLNPMQELDPESDETALTQKKSNS
ncbi:hypothetical protein SIPHO054v2_p0010 [Vibrio phage 103E44.1]|nr:hypothetical protein SIPHO054v2_p0010 [Vibrio phage 103E44.1]QZI87866.1 hypothetical protein SIPHO055v2_p0010 [Vibrio phage 104E43.1]